jgi:hypothetical protein
MDPEQRRDWTAVVKFLKEMIEVVFWKGQLQPLRIYQVRRIWKIAKLAIQLTGALIGVAFDKESQSVKQGSTGMLLG